MAPPRLSTGRRFSTIFFALLAAAGLCGGAAAQVTSGNAFTITGVDVDTAGPDALKARDQAVREAKRRAVGMLVERMVAPEDRKKVPPVDDARLEGMIRGVEFAKERSSANRFAGTLNVVFSADQVKSWLSEAGISVAETVARPALLIPLWKGKNGVEQLDDRNAWRDAWTKLDTAASAVPLTVVRGDQLDQNAMSVEEAYVGDVAALTRLNERYRLPTIIVAVVEGDKDSGELSVGGYRYDTQTGARSDLSKVTVPAAAQLADACPNGIDVYFENVGGAVQDAVFPLMNPFGRIIMCGMVAQYNDPTPPPGPNLGSVVGKRLRIEGLIVTDKPERAAEWRALAEPWVKDGSLKYRETVIDGLDNAAEAFCLLLQGGNFGKMLVRIGADPA